MKHFVSKTVKRYVKNESGQFAIYIALLGLPLIGMATFAIEYNNHQRLNTHASDALDSAALASIINQTMTAEDRRAYAEKYFWDNAGFSKERVKFTVESSTDDKIVLSAKTKTTTSVAGAIGVMEIESDKRASAVLTKGEVICALTLDPIGRNAFDVTNGGTFTAPTCSVQVNSTHTSAANVSLGSTGHAKDFCVAGGITGSFSPYANTQCHPVQDPYKNVETPAEGPCVDAAELTRIFSDWRIYTNGATLKPGTYCGGLNLTAFNVTLEPGIYIMKDGPLIVNSGSSLSGDEVSIVMSGQNSVLSVLNGSSLDINAPKTGPLAGLAIFEQSGAKKLFKETTLIGGANLTVVGTIYLPEQNITFIGGSKMATKAPATSFIANTIKITQGAYVEVDVDHRTAGLPPLLPRSDEGARLVE